MEDENRIIDADSIEELKEKIAGIEMVRILKMGAISEVGGRFYLPVVMKQVERDYAGIPELRVIVGKQEESGIVVNNSVRCEYKDLRVDGTENVWKLTFWINTRGYSDAKITHQIYVVSENRVSFDKGVFRNVVKNLNDFFVLALSCKTVAARVYCDLLDSLLKEALYRFNGRGLQFCKKSDLA